MSKKDLIFISHAAPEQNYLASWLASKLQLIGYEVWVDVEDLRAGSSFWNEIELKMRNHSIRFISLVSEEYIAKSRESQSGVNLEVTLASKVAKDIENYIIPVKVDHSSYDEFPINMLPLNTVDFSRNWGSGLKTLLDELEVQLIPKGKPEQNALLLWHKYHKIKGDVIPKLDSYGSNWFDYKIPKSIFIYEYHGDIKNLYKSIPFPFVPNGNYIMGFFEDKQINIPFNHREESTVEEFILNGEFQLMNGDVIKDTSQKLVRLLNKSINEHFYSLDNFGCFKASGKNKVFYPRYGSCGTGYVSLKLFNKRGRKLYSKTSKYLWRFGASFSFQLNPFPHLIVNYHLVSSDENGILSKDLQVKARRSIPNEWYNRDWYERILAFMHLGSSMNKDLKLNIQTGIEDIEINLRSISFTSKMGYNENL